MLLSRGEFHDAGEATPSIIRFFIVQQKKRLPHHPAKKSRKEVLAIKRFSSPSISNKLHRISRGLYAYHKFRKTKKE